MLNIKKFLGFTKTGTSTLGKYARSLLGKRGVSRMFGIILIASFTFVILTHNLANIGGNLTLATNGVKPVIDVTTQVSIQKPMEDFVQTRGVSWYHAGADLAAPIGTSVKSIMVGTIRAVNKDLFSYGNHVIIMHDQNMESLYGHLSKIYVEPGQKVDLNTIIGEVGSTGFSTGPHLHLEIHQNGQLVNPAEIVPGVK